MLKYSRQREIIKQAVKSCASHLSAGEVYEFLRPTHPGLSLGTVYRNLTLLANNGEIRKLAMPGGTDRFDGATHEHGHAVCNRCGKVCDVDAGLGAGLAGRVLAETGYVVTGCQILITGLCAQCAEKEEYTNA